MSRGGITGNGEMTVGVNNSSQRISLSGSVENGTGFANPVQLALLTKKIVKLEKRLSRVEERLESNIRRTSFSLSTDNESKVGAKGDLQKPTCGCELSEARKCALGTVNHVLISNKPYNLDFLSKVRNVFVVIKRNTFSRCQFLLMLLMISALLVFVIISFKDAYNSTIDMYKPVKIEAQDDYLQSKELTYQIPPHYFIFDMWVEPRSFNISYFKWYGHNCMSSVEDCLSTHLSYLWSSHEDEYGVGNVFLYASCARFGRTYVGSMGNITFSIASLGDDENFENFLVSLKIEFHEIEEDWNEHWFQCSLWLDIDSLYLSMVVSYYTIYFTVSRTDYSSPSQINNEYIRSGLEVFNSHVYENLAISQLKTIEYRYDESIYDGVSHFVAEVSKWASQWDLNIVTIANPTVFHYVSYDRYSYTDWLADVGGCFTLLTTLFFVLAQRVTNYANRNDPLRRRQGILPVISQTYRNAEELAGLRYLVLSAFGISEEAYFADEL